jgi:hypothetical protein
MRKREPVEHEFLIIKLMASGKLLRTVRAPDEEAAKLAALATFYIRPIDRIIAGRRE